MAGTYPQEQVIKFALTSDKACELVIGKYKISPEYFTDSNFSNIFLLVYNYFGKYNKLIPAELFSRELSKSRIPDAAKPEVIQTFTNLSDTTDVSYDTIDYWIEELKRERLARQLQASMMSALDEVDTGDGVYRAYEKLSESLSEIETIIDPNAEETVAINDEGWVRSRLELYQNKVKHPENYSGVKTGLTELDLLTNGICAGELWVVVSRTNVGKSAFLNVCAHNAFRYGGKNVLFAGLEMGLDANSVRFDALYSGLSAKAIRNGWLTPEDYSQYEAALIDLTYERNKLFYIPQRKAQTVQQIQRELTLTERKHNVKIDMVVIDYLNILHTATPGGSRLSQHELARLVAEDCRALGWLHNVAVLTAAQLNRLGADNKADVGTEAVAGSDFIGNTADFMMRLVQTPDDAQRNVIKGVVMKARQSERKTLEFMVDLNRMYIGDMQMAVPSLD